MRNRDEISTLDLNTLIWLSGYSRASADSQYLPNLTKLIYYPFSKAQWLNNLWDKNLFRQERAICTIGTAKRKAAREVDFLIEKGSEIIPIEVKNGASRSLKRVS